MDVANYIKNGKLYLIVGLSILLTSGLAAYKVTTLLIETSSWVSHTHEVETSLESIISQLTDAETGQRGFILTNKTEYLVPYEHGKQSIFAVLKTAKSLTSDNPIQQQRLDEIETLVNLKLNELAQTIELFKAGNRAEALDLINTNQGINLMDNIRAIVDDMKIEERELLDIRETKHHSAVQISTILTTGGSTIVFLTIVALALFFRKSSNRYVRERDIAELKLNKTVKELEKSLSEIKTLEGIIRICSYCHNICEMDGPWDKLEAYISRHTDAKFSHGICPVCIIKVRTEEGLD